MLLTLGRGLNARSGRRQLWLPTHLSDLIGWYDAADPATITATGAAVDEWRDKSGVNNHMLGNASFRPTTGSHSINDQNVITFASSCLSLTGNVMGGPPAGLDKTDCCIAFVFKQPAATGAAPVYLRQSTAGDAISPNFSTLDRLYMPGTGETSSLYVNPSPAANGSAYHMMVNFAPGAITAFINNTAALTHGSGASGNHIDRFIIGARPYNGTFWSGQLAEMCLFSRALIDAERLALNAYFTAKWAL